MRPVFLLSDFGTRDAYVGVMKAVILDLAPGAQVVDLVHDLPPQDLAGARLQLGAALPYLPDGAVLCAVVDPGVGSDRRAVAVVAAGEGRTLTAVAPDNGLLSPLLGEGWSPRSAVALDRTRIPRRGPGTTFDGRDLFAPAAARLAAGEGPEHLGTPLALSLLVREEERGPVREDGVWTGQVVWIDRFGNLVTDLTPRHLGSEAAALRVALGDLVLAGLSRAFSDVAAGAPVAYLGSLGRLEIGVRDGDAAARTGARVGDAVRVWAAPSA